MSLSEACKRKRLGSSALSMPLQQMVLTQSAVVPQESSSSNQDASVIQSSSNTLQQNLFNEPKLPYCLLCEGVFATIGTRDAHLRKHEEQWKDCPVCQMERVTHEVTSHEELFQHVIAKHSRRTVSGQEVTMICSLCYTCLKSDSSQTLRRIEEQIFRHIIYMCNTVDRCFICNNGRTIQPDDLKKHRKKQHNHLYERFGCSACPKKFFTHGDYSEHICNLRIQCACGARDEFSEREYEKHFKTHLNFVGDFCLLCNKYLASKQQRYTHAGVHRLARPGDRREIDLNHKSRLSSSRTASSSLINAPSVAQSVCSFRNLLSETMSATQSIVSQSMPVPNTFLANVRMESDNSQTAPICERSHATLPRINISNETNKEAVNGVVERLVNEVAGEAEQFDEESQRTSSSSSTSPRSTPPPQLNDERQQTTMQHLIESTQARRSQLNPSNSGDVILILQMPPPNDCQQVSSDQQISYHTIVQALATGGTIQQNAPTIVGSCSNDNNSNNNNNNNNNNNGDDDDDDIQIIEDDEAVMDKQTNTNTAHDTGEKTGHADDSEQNDGVVVQNADVVDENAITASESLHLEEIHDEGDDEVQAVAAGKGLGIEKAKKREPKIVCPHCTAKFVTHVALEAHSASHRYDAGNTIEEVLGVPLKETVYICRLCCLAYESETVYGRHMQTHGQLQNCPYCSMVAFNEDQLQQHLQQHTNAGQCLTYACYRCADTYSSDERLYHHAMRRHQLMLMYYCKNCGIGSTDGKIVYNHIVRHACVSQQAALSSASKLGVAPASMFHYQPLKVKQYEDAVSKSTLSVVTPSDCIHRSFLISQNEHILITCPLCYCLVGFILIIIIILL
ncbi:unnamed protein product [Anisakis simplex]|uniref:C2H2-type domain-containing protein n=1 Tax=Anisakis simplex TaxID=6269 RepID=A0A0M3K9F1_ANISI|nr:unnamed protein product [Anisakis simplex]